MLVTSIIIFVLTALGGAFLAVTRIREDTNPPMPVALFHGAVAAAGLITLLVYIVGAGLPTLPTIAAALFVVAAIGGFVAFASHVRGTLISKGLVGVHAVAAVSGFVVLVVAALIP